MTPRLKDQDWRTERLCAVCDQPFMPRNRTQIFCPAPNRCRYTNKGRKLIEAQAQGTKDDRECEGCGITFTPWARDQKKCSTSCPGKPRETKRCLNSFCQAEFMPGLRTGNRQKYCSKECGQKAETIQVHNITINEYNEMWTAQGGVCAICKTNDPGKGAGKGHLHVDHDHECCPGPHSCGNCVRGLVCFGCNAMMGNGKDDPNVLLQGVMYLMNYQTKKATKLREKPVFVAK